MIRFIRDNTLTLLRLVGLLGLVIWVLFLFSYRNTAQSQPASSQITPAPSLTTASLTTPKTPRSNYVSELFMEQQHESSLSLEQIRSLSQQQQQDGIAYDISTLEELYRKTKDKHVFASLITTLVDQFRFDTAYQYLMGKDDTLRDTLDGTTIAYILANSPEIKYNNPKKIQELRIHIASLFDNKRISQDDFYLYQGILAFLQKDIRGMQKQFDTISVGKYESFRQSIRQSIDTYVSQQDLPEYYMHALIALDFMRHGYFKIAQQTAIHIVTQDSAYILPYQILAYSHFVMNDWDIASDYLISLKEKDPQYVDRYNFLLGVCYFWQEKYVDAVLFLSQDTLGVYDADALRYLALSYDALGDTSHLMYTYQKLLGQEDLSVHDFYLFFEQIFFVPFANEEPFQLASQYQTISALYLKQCYQKLSSADQGVCDYGQAGRHLSQGEGIEAGKILKDLGQSFPKAYVFRALGEYYLQTKNISQAKKYFMKTLSLTADEQQKATAKSRLFDIIDLE